MCGIFLLTLFSANICVSIVSDYVKSVIFNCQLDVPAGKRVEMVCLDFKVSIFSSFLPCH